MSATMVRTIARYALEPFMTNAIVAWKLTVSRGGIDIGRGVNQQSLLQWFKLLLGTHSSLYDRCYIVARK